MEPGSAMGETVIDVVELISDLDQRADLHLARILLLLDAFSEGDTSGSIEGLTKLAKLDFLLRYPVMLERALEAREKSTREVNLEDYERHSVESEMVRYRFGPWDHRYREFLNILVAKGLANVSVDGRRIVISTTANGKALAAQLAEISEFKLYVRRARILKRHFDLTGTGLMRFIYETFPEVVSLRSNTPISI